MTESSQTPRGFALMPFGSRGGTDFEKVYQSAIKVACQKVGVRCMRSEASTFSGKVLRNIHNSIAKADFVIADLTGRDSNVLYEMGYAVSLKKPVLLLAKDASDVPSDVNDQRVVIYDGDIHRLRDNLVASLKELLRQPPVETGDARKGVAGTAGDTNVETAGKQSGLVFISYSHLNELWLERLKFMYKPLVWRDKILVWDDKRIPAGSEWDKEIDRALSSAKVAVLLVSQGFLASDFIREKELPRIIAAAKMKRLAIIWALLEVCFYETTELVKFQAAHDIKYPLDSLNRQKRNVALRNICVNISEALSI